ncbi:hypothetical protein PITCH_A350020 [uncultured Desulfobacterium sp.]|uniref:Lipoprotein n=1 Tax=uncultured Desulfobacterium sp. TaxID=201089 RepID=A0A445MZP0_9BACT|nr:hypothetical protein PITCH_A350020 [uncultured Desulfobacterium sp.]
MKCFRFMLMFGVVMICGCGIGYNTTLFFTKSNIGLDLETKPPTAELSISRREGVIAPGFEGGQTPPVVSSFQSRQNPLSRFFFSVQSTFAGGDAAVALSRRPGDTSNDSDSNVYLTQKPEPKTFWGNKITIPEKGQVRPFVFGTDTTVGLKLAWSGMTSELPDTVRLGFNRKEFALAPVFGTDSKDEIDHNKYPAATYAVGMPSFLAVLDSDINITATADAGVTWLQYIATGKSATALAQQDEARRILLNRIDPVAFPLGQ